MTCPPHKGAALSIVRLAQQDDVSASQLEQVIKADPAFVGRLLKTANIKGRESGRPIASVSDAVNVLGLSVVRNLALGFSLVSGYRAGTCSAFDYSGFWTRSVVNALALQSIVRRTQWAIPKKRFAAACSPASENLRWPPFIRGSTHSCWASWRGGDCAAGNYDAALRVAEREVFALHHDDLTAAMLTDWGFPRSLLEPIYFRHDPEHSGFVPGSREQRLLAAACLAEAVVESASGPVRCGISIGVATRAAAMDNTRMLIRAADEAMCRDKLGRRVRSPVPSD